MSLAFRRFLLILAIIVVVWMAAYLLVNFLAFPGEPNTLFRTDG